MYPADDRFSGPFRGSTARAVGWLSRAELYGPRYRRIFPDIYLPAGCPLNLTTRSHAAFLYVRDQGGILAGYSASLMLGADCAPSNAPAEVAVSTRTRRQPGLLVHHGAIDSADVLVREHVRYTNAARTAWDLARRLPLVEAVVAVDALARHGAFAPTDLITRRAACPGARGARRLDRVVELANPRAESAMETRLRLALILDGLPEPLVQFTIVDEYGFGLARADLAYPNAKLDIEYDGSHHHDPRQAVRDRQRDATLAAQGWLTLRLTYEDATIGLSQTLSRIDRTLAARRTSPARP